MKSFDSLVFDLDGTLWDTSAACAVSWNRVLAKHRISFREITEDDVRRVTGKPHEACIRETFKGLPESTISLINEETTVEDSRVIQEVGGVLYPEVKEGLEALSNRYRLFIVSNCQSGYIETFLEFAKLEKCFADIECWGNTKKAKSENLASVIERNQLKSPVMIGDMDSDLIAARACGIPFFHVTYGFGSVAESDRSFSSFADLCAAL